MRHHTAPRSVACHGASMTHAKRMIPTATLQVKHIGLFGGVVHRIWLSPTNGDWTAGLAHENLGPLHQAGGVAHTTVRGRWIEAVAGVLLTAGRYWIPTLRKLWVARKAVPRVHSPVRA